jgi:phenylpyruvate tautomerase PptA (4-oxalocrotonate tautomerase family)
MAQVKVYGLKDHLDKHTTALSDAIHTCVVEALHYPMDKRFHRFIDLLPERFIYPADRGEAYTILEISMFEGRSVEAKKKLINLLFQRLHSDVGIPPHSVEITIFETPKANWGIRGKPGDELVLNYQVAV